VLYVFDLLWLDGTDLREQPLIERKRLLRSVVPEQSSALLYADHIEQNGVERFAWSVIWIWKGSSRSGGAEPTVIDGGRFGIRIIRSTREGTSCLRSVLTPPRKVCAAHF
jgi:hypothetical protein